MTLRTVSWTILVATAVLLTIPVTVNRRCRQNRAPTPSIPAFSIASLFGMLALASANLFDFDSTRGALRCAVYLVRWRSLVHGFLLERSR